MWGSEAPASLALVDDQVAAGGVGVRAHPLPPGVDREPDLLGAEVGEEVTGSGALTITSCPPSAGWAVNRSG